MIPGVKFVLADMNADNDLWNTDMTGKMGLIIGSEAHGAGETASRLADIRVRIPMDSMTESLNAAVAGAILIYEIRRQRSMANK